MLRIDSRSTNFNGSSVINNDVFISLSASISEPDNNGYISINISDMAKFRASLAAIKLDVSDFIEELSKLSATDDEEE